MKKTTKKNIIFVHIPKTAGTSFIKTYQNDGIRMWGHDIRKTHYQYFSDLRRMFIARYFPFLIKGKIYTFAVVRNTWERVFSAYTYLNKGKGNTEDDQDATKYVKHYKNFEDFILNGLAKASKEQLHFLPQTRWIYNRYGFSVVHRLIRFENLENDIKKTMETIGIPYKRLPVYNKSNNKNYKDFYTQEMIDKVAEIYQDEIKKLKYTFEK